MDDAVGCQSQANNIVSVYSQVEEERTATVRAHHRHFSWVEVPGLRRASEHKAGNDDAEQEGHDEDVHEDGEAAVSSFADNFMQAENSGESHWNQTEGKDEVARVDAIWNEEAHCWYPCPDCN